jgi:hypothetical protein
MGANMSHERVKRGVGRWLMTALSIGMFMAWVGVGFAANPANGLRIEVIAAYNLVVDSNVESPSTYAPHSAYLGAKFYNEGTARPRS